MKPHRYALAGIALLSYVCPVFGFDESADRVDIADLGMAVEEHELAAETGRLNIDIDEINLQLSDLKLSANLGENVNHSGTTGSNSIGQDAFSGISGLATVIQNTGNQVIIQNAMIINLTVR